MTSVTQQIPNFIQGVSDQPDELKNIGQLRKCVNGYPDLISGLVKRNGIKWIGELDTTQDGKWFHIEKEDPLLGQELYLGHISRTGSLSVWDAETGVEQKVCYTNDPVFRKAHRTLSNPPTREIDESTLTCYNPGESGGAEDYFVHDKDSDLQTVTVNDYTFVTNRLKFPQMVQSKNNPEYYECFVEVSLLNYGRVYIFGIYDLDGNEIATPSYNAPTTGNSQISVDKILDEWIDDMQGIGVPQPVVQNKTGTWVTDDIGADKLYTRSPEEYTTTSTQIINGTEYTVEEKLEYNS